MRFLSVCSGIEAASVAWHPLGWRAAAFAEIEPFPCSVLAHHYPTVPNWGDMTRFKEWPNADVDVLVGGTPCQSFSVAGLRKGLDDPRGNLALTFLAVAARYRPRWVVWENVPGVLSSNGGRDFGSFLGALGQLGYGWAYRVLDAQYVRTRMFGGAVPQRRRRVFVVGYLGDWRPPAAVFFDRESLSGHPPPRREAGKGVAPCLAARTRGGGGLGTDAELDGALIPQVTHALRGEGFDASEDGTGRGTPIIPDVCGTLSDGAHNGGGLNGQDAYTGRILPVAIQERAVSESPDHGPQGAGFRQDGLDYTLEARNKLQAVAFDCKGTEVQFDATGSAPPLRSMGHNASHANAGGHSAIATRWAVRRLTPIECERLQGFPDGYTLVPHRGKPVADGPRYKALGNSMAVNAMEWIGERIALVEGIVGGKP